MKLVVTTFLSLDGVYQAPGGPDEDRSDGFEHGGWMAPLFDDDLMRYMNEWIGRVDAFLLGRRTYDIFANYWPKVTDESDTIAAVLNGKPKYVVSRTLRDPAWAGTTVIAGDVPGAVAALKAEPGREIQVHGSGVLLRTLMEHDLVDEYRLWFYPVILGSGRKLFGDWNPPRSLTLVDKAYTSSGAAIHTYRPEGPLTYGQIGE
jgi:dihydrofolate reductase